MTKRILRVPESVFYQTKSKLIYVSNINGKSSAKDGNGFIPLGNGRFILSDWAGKIQLISTDKAPVILSNTTKQKINAADLGFIPGKKIILIPAFFDNRVVAEQLIDF